MIKNKDTLKKIKTAAGIEWKLTRDVIRDYTKHGMTPPKDIYDGFLDKLDGPFDVDQIEYEYDVGDDVASVSKGSKQDDIPDYMVDKRGDYFHDSDLPDPDSILQFKKDPLSVIMLFTAYSSWLEHSRTYDCVFNRTWVGKQDYTSERSYNKEMLSFTKPTKKHVVKDRHLISVAHAPKPKQAMSISLFTADNLNGLKESWELIQRDAIEIKEYYREKFAYQKLQGEIFGSFEEDLTEFIKLSDAKQCKLKHIAQVVKLDQFHVSATSLEKLAEGFDSFDEKNETTLRYPEVEPGSIILDAEVKFECIHKTYISRERSEVSYLIFRTKENNLLKVEHKKDDFYEKVLGLFKDQYIHIRAQASIKNNPLTGFIHLDSRYIEIPHSESDLEPFFA